MDRLGSTDRRGGRDGGQEDDEASRIQAVRRYGIIGNPPDNSFEHVARIAASALGTPIATVTIVDEDRIWLKARVGVDAEHVAREPGLCASAIMTDGVTVIEDAIRDPIALNNSLVRGQMGLRFYAAAPIVTADGYRLGTVNAIDVEPRSITEKEAEILRWLAAIVADALELRLAALRTVGRERRVAAEAGEAFRSAELDATTLVKGLTPPQLPSIAGVELASHYAPANGRLAGDFYDVFPMSDTLSGFIIGDVMGHELESGVFSALARWGLRSALAAGASPQAALDTLNQLMQTGESEDVRFCTAICGTFKRHGKKIELTFANAGHPAPHVRRANQAIERIDGSGRLLGCFESTGAFAVRTVLHPGDVMLFYTDGLIEARFSGTFLGEDGVARLLEDTGDWRVRDLVRRVASVLDQKGVVAQDDVVVLGIQASRP